MRSGFAKIQGSLNHPVLKGQANEETVRRFLRQYLPKTLDIAGGALVDLEGTQSGQPDPVISDAANTPVFFRPGESGAVRVILVEGACREGQPVPRSQLWSGTQIVTP
jgi:hypothetical protein